MCAHFNVFERSQQFVCLVYLLFSLYGCDDESIVIAATTLVISVSLSLSLCCCCRAKRNPGICCVDLSRSFTTKPKKRIFSNSLTTVLLKTQTHSCIIQPKKKKRGNFNELKKKKKKNVQVVS